MNDCHLPGAVRFRTRKQLAALADHDLGAMLTECRDWTACMANYRSALMTAAALTEWRVHTARDRAEVVAAISRLEREIQNRIDSPFHSMLVDRRSDIEMLQPA